MKRSRLFAGILALVALGIAIIQGCASSPYATQQRRGPIIISPNPAPGVSNVSSRVVHDLPEPTQEELWIIGRADKRQAASGDVMVPGSGVLAAQEGEKLIPVPLKHTDVKASIAGYIATVDVTQQYENPYSSKIEAGYVFRLA